MLTFEWPALFWLLPLPLLFRLIPGQRKTTVDAVFVPASFTGSQEQRQYQRGNEHSRWSLATLLAIMWLGTITAAANPRWQGDAIELPSNGRDLLLAVDISGSMETPDMFYQGQSINRLQAVKAVVSEFVERRVGDRLGLILFGTNAYLQAPLTFDRATVGQLLSEAQLGFAGEKTAIGDAIGLAIKRLRNRPEASRLLILLTDGANTAGNVSPQQAATLAAAANVKIYTIGLGSEEMNIPGLLGSNFGARTVNPSLDLDEKSLEQIASATGGRYFRARNPEELQNIYALLDELEPSEQDSEVFRPQRSLFYLPLALALLASVIAFITAHASAVKRRPANELHSEPEHRD
ncbi:VWA domain-containing protein [Simiduia curdlanivorans]|uniref:VWA domain-containing protein n=1 Tax=Simiduia curdlanivorans TaxID=1492769 RepID=A0ABV8V893_9GAMM|nr:VWA domain-containing protein [Simiduia curdlanivorans]MDN3639540.1 VWA domain-containing protein [Simiduia curdlanivorans]